MSSTKKGNSKEEFYYQIVRERTVIWEGKTTALKAEKRIKDLQALIPDYLELYVRMDDL